MRLWFRKKQLASVDVSVWLDWLEISGCKPRTIDGYRRDLGHFLEQYPHVALGEITPEMITGYVEQAGPRSRQRRRSPFQNLFRWAHYNGRVEENPMHRVPTYRQPKQEPPDVFTFAEQRILEALPFPDGILCAILLGTGLRKAEARNLTVRRIDFETSELHIVEGAKGDSAGVAPIEPALLARLDELITLEGLNPTDYLWYGRPGGAHKRQHHRPLSDAGMQKFWVRVMADSGIPYRNLHVTRHTYATNWRRRGLSLDDVGFALRHADFKTTKQVYDHTNIVDIRRRMDQLPSLAEVLS